MIETAAQLNDVRNALDKSYKLNANIELDVAPYNIGDGWSPIGVSGSSFSGLFDGAGFTISGLTIKKPNENNIGLFGAVSNAQIINVNLTNVDIEGKDFVGGLIGYENKSDGKIIGNSVSGVVSGDVRVGGMVGRTNGTGTTPATSPEETTPTIPLANFVDVANHWAEEVIKQAVQDGIVNGYPDDADVPTWAKGAVEAVRLSGIIQGRGGNRFMAQDNATRAEALTMIVRMVGAK